MNVDILSLRILVNYADRNEFWDWCQERGIECQYCGFSSHEKDIWYIENEKHRVLAILKWT